MNMKKNLNKSVFSKDIVEFVTVANEYCKYFESLDNKNLSDVLSVLVRILPLAYLKASLLPVVEPGGEEILQEALNENDYNLICSKVSRIFAEYDISCNVPVINSQDGETGTAPVSEIIADIYQAMKEFVLSYKSGNEAVINDAAFNCREYFMQYWGPRLIALQAVIHNLYFNSEVETQTFMKEYQPSNPENNCFINKRQKK